MLRRGFLAADVMSAALIPPTLLPLVALSGALLGFLLWNWSPLSLEG